MAEHNDKTRKYRAPKLIRYGDMARLTAGGGSTGTESPPNSPGQPTKFT